MLISESERERQCIRYAVLKWSCTTFSEARRKYGFDRMDEKAAQVEACIKQAEEIHREIDELARTQDKAFLESLGIQDDSSSESDGDVEMEVDSTDKRTSLPDIATLHNLLSASQHNWFEFVERVECMVDDNLNTAGSLEEFFLQIPSLEIEQAKLKLTVQSHRAFMASSVQDCEQDKIARAINGEVVSDSDSEPECLVGVSTININSEEGKIFIKKKRMAIKNKAARLRKKAKAERKFLSRQVSNRTSKLLQDCPNIGAVIESFVQDNNIGADVWRRTGVLTFDGNTKLGKKVTYKRIQEHVEKVFGRKVSYGSIVELCIPRNKRRRSAKRYKGLARVTTRRARKGFTLKYNPDAHWSAAFYKGLNSIQYVDGRFILNINRDDAANFRLDTLTTCKQHPNPVVQGKDILTTRTDYVNRYPSVTNDILQFHWNQINTRNLCGCS